jgi:hypothetical protein
MESMETRSSEKVVCEEEQGQADRHHPSGIHVVVSGEMESRALGAREQRHLLGLAQGSQRDLIPIDQEKSGCLAHGTFEPVVEWKKVKVMLHHPLQSRYSWRGQSPALH